MAVILTKLDMRKNFKLDVVLYHIKWFNFGLFFIKLGCKISGIELKVQMKPIEPSKIIKTEQLNGK